MNVKTYFSKSVFRVLVLRPRFAVVALFAKRLPVGFIPEQNHIFPVRLDMVDNGCRCQFSTALALRAKRMLCQELFSRFLPPAAIAALLSAFPVMGMQLGMKFTIAIIR